MNTNLPKYSAYQPTESEWLSEIPVGWEAIQLARLNNKLTNGFVGPTRDILREKGVRYLQSLHIKGGRILFDTPYFVSAEWSAAHQKSVLKSGDVLIVQTGDIGQVAVVTDEFTGCNCHALIIVSAKRKMIDGFFLSAVLRSHYGFHSLKSVQTGALHPHLNCTNIRDIYLPVPPLGDQRAILAFLDRDCDKIDRLMNTRRKQIERLLEQRTAVIHHTVTKGLDPHAKMKPTDVEWLGEVPVGWDVAPLWAVAKMTVSNVDKKSLPSEQPVRLCNYVDVYQNERIDASLDFMEATAVAPEIAKFLLREGDVIITKDSETADDIGVPAIVAEVVPRLLCGYHLAILRATPAVLPEYLLRLFQTPYVRSYLATKAQGVTRFGLSQNAITRCPVPLPPIGEQETIGAYINIETAKIDSLISKYQKEVDLLFEYRAALISHAVTGKIDVRGLVVPDTPELVEYL
jgi:type I restriction enzyme S subunit